MRRFHVLIGALVAALVPGLAFAQGCERTSGSGPRVIDRAEMRSVIRICANEDGQGEERRVLMACNSLVRLACTPLSGRVLSTEERNTAVWAFALRSNAYLSFDHPIEAIADMDNGLAMQSSDAFLLLSRCRVRAIYNLDLALARADCDTALGLDANLPLAYDGRGLIALRQGDFAAAVSEFDAALAREPALARRNTAGAWRGLGLAMRPPRRRISPQLRRPIPRSPSSSAASGCPRKRAG